jgi:DNA-binding XRE family transcriptional regulator
MYDDLQNRLIKNMVDNLVVLRTKIQLKQIDLASKVGISRQTLLAIENKQRELSWSVFLALFTVFNSNEETKALLGVMGISPETVNETVKI